MFKTVGKLLCFVGLVGICMGAGAAGARDVLIKDGNTLNWYSLRGAEEYNWSLGGMPLRTAIPALGFPSGEVSFKHVRYITWEHMYREDKGLLAMGEPQLCKLTLAVTGDDLEAIILGTSLKGPMAECNSLAKAIVDKFSAQHQQSPEFLRRREVLENTVKTLGDRWSFPS